MGQPKDLRGYPPRFWEVLEQVGGKGKTLRFDFPHTEEGRRRCHTLHMKICGFRSALRNADAEEQPADIIAMAWDLCTRKAGPYSFIVHPQESFDEEINRALNSPPGE